MNIVNKLTLRHLKENKGRSIVTTLGICVSVALITAVFVAVASFLNLFGESNLYYGGNYHFQVKEKKEKIEEIFENYSNEIDAVAYSYSPENDYAGYRIPQGTVMRHSIGSWVVGDEQYFKQFVTCDYEGALPKNSNEIMVEQDIIEKNNLDWEIGDTVEIDSGYRKSSASTDSFSFPVKGSYSFGETFLKSETKSYKIVGILHDNLPTAYTGGILRGMTDDEYETVTASVLMKKVNINTLREINSIIDDFNFSEEIKPFCVSINNDYLETKFAVAPENSSLLDLLPMCLILLVIIMVASVALIYNAFSMSYAEKVRYLGMLSSVGATKAQKKRSVYFEGFVLGLIGVPVGFGAGVLGIGITLKAIGGEMIKSGMIYGKTDMDFKVVVPLYCVIGTLVLSVITILISVFKPARKASAIMPIEAIRQTNEIKLKKRIKTPRIIRKIFGYEGELAHKNLKRNGRKSRVITASIALSVILFLSCNYFCDMFVRYKSLNDNNPIQVEASVKSSDSDEFEMFLSENSDINNYFFYDTEYFSKKINDNINEDEDLFFYVKFDFLNDKTVSKKYFNIIGSDIFIYINCVEDDDFNRLCEFSGIDKNQFYDIAGDGKINCLVMNNISHKTGDEGVFTDNLLGDSVYYYMLDENGNEIKDIPFAIEYVFGGFAKYDENNYICSLNTSNSISCYFPRSVYEQKMDAIMEQDGEDSYYIVSYGIQTDKHEKVAEDIGDFFESNNYDGCSYSDYVESLQMMNSTIFILQVLIYGFISLITLITIFNIINTVSTSIALRKKEFAMLKSVGTTPKGFNKMIVLESAFYGIKALIFALPISVIVNYAINRALGEATLPFEINWLLYLAVIAVVFLIVGFTMLFSVYKLKNDSIVETLKEEIN